MPAVKPASPGALPAITISLPSVFDKVIELSEFKTAVTPDASWLISVIKLAKLVWIDMVFEFIVNVSLILKLEMTDEVKLLNPVATAPWLDEFALIAVASAVAVLFPEVKLLVKVAARAFSPFIKISFAAKLEL